VIAAEPASNDASSERTKQAHCPLQLILCHEPNPCAGAVALERPRAVDGIRSLDDMGVYTTWTLGGRATVNVCSIFIGASPFRATPHVTPTLLAMQLLRDGVSTERGGLRRPSLT
jgi:hypothetical protein